MLKSVLNASFQLPSTRPLSRGPLNFAMQSTASYEATNGYTRTLRIYSSAATGTLAIGTGAGSVSAAYVAPTAQVETITAVGTITTAGLARVVIAATDTTLVQTISFAVNVDDTAATVAAKARAALNVDVKFKKSFTVSGTSTAIIITRIVDDVGLANDSALSATLSNQTCAGLTTAASANTTAGALATGAKWDATSGNPEGKAVDISPMLVAVQVERGTIDTVTGSLDNLKVSNLTAPAHFLYHTSPGLYSIENLVLEGVAPAVVHFLVAGTAPVV